MVEAAVAGLGRDPHLDLPFSRHDPRPPAWANARPARDQLAARRFPEAVEQAAHATAAKPGAPLDRRFAIRHRPDRRAPERA